VCVAAQNRATAATLGCVANALLTIMGIQQILKIIGYIINILINLKLTSNKIFNHPYRELVI